MNDKENDQTGKPATRQLDINLLKETSADCDVRQCLDLLDRGADVNAADEDGCTPLIWAALSGKRETVELLIARGGDVNCKDSDGQTPLHIAATTGDVAMARLLIEKGADVNARDYFGITPLRSAALNEDSAMVDLLSSKGGKQR
ncbi:MAG TPA: ankyrin repeat domain-containing protein [bacterium]|nr:ankyrin repeat domain-containing protein [bacterium]